MEYCEGGSVKDVMRQLGRTMTEEQIGVILRDVLSGLNYLHTNDKIHRDVKAANILLDGKGVAKLGDFGVSEPVDNSIKKPTFSGTLLWMPPEVVRQEPNYSTAIDIWSLGITVIEMGDGQPPYSDLDQSDALKEIADGKKRTPTFRDPSKWSNKCLEFVGLCLDKESSTRKTAQELLDHELIRKASSNDVIRELVQEVCSNSFANIEQESSMYQQSECLLKESLILFGIYNERRMKVIKVDQITDSLRNFEIGFKKLRNALVRPNVNESRIRLKSLTDEIEKLEQEHNNIRTILTNLRSRKTDIERECKKVKALEDEVRRRIKLSALEYKNI